MTEHTAHTKAKADTLARRADEHKMRNEWVSAIRLYLQAEALYREIKEYGRAEAMRNAAEYLES